MLVNTNKKIYDSSGLLVGTKVEDRSDVFEIEELPRCLECEGFLMKGRHHQMFIKTGQSGFGDVEGYYRNCSTGKSRGEL